MKAIIHKITQRIHFVPLNSLKFNNGKNKYININKNMYTRL